MVTASEVKQQLEMAVKQWLEFVENTVKSTGLPIVPDQKTSDPLYVDMREMRLKYIIPVARIKRFFYGLAEGKILATKCKVGGELFFPPQVDCPKHFDAEFEWVELDGRGELLTYTVVNVKPASFMHYPDYTVGIAKLREGVNIMAWVRLGEGETLKPGMKVRARVVRREPENVYVMELVPD